MILNIPAILGVPVWLITAVPITPLVRDHLRTVSVPPRRARGER
jgi:hypothetical protein